MGLDWCGFFSRAAKPPRVFGPPGRKREADAGGGWRAKRSARRRWTAAERPDERLRMEALRRPDRDASPGSPAERSGERAEGERPVRLCETERLREVSRSDTSRFSALLRAS